MAPGCSEEGILNGWVIPFHNALVKLLEWIAVFFRYSLTAMFVLQSLKTES